MVLPAVGLGESPPRLRPGEARRRLSWHLRWEATSLWLVQPMPTGRAEAGGKFGGRDGWRYKKSKYLPRPGNRELCSPGPASAPLLHRLCLQGGATLT